MILSSFIRNNQETIIAEWEKFARSVPVAQQMNRAELRDHVVALLTFITNDLETYQSSWEQSEKSRGRGTVSDAADDMGGRKHRRDIAGRRAEDPERKRDHQHQPELS